MQESASALKTHMCFAGPQTAYLIAKGISRPRNPEHLACGVICRELKTFPDANGIFIPQGNFSASDQEVPTRGVRPLPRGARLPQGSIASAPPRTSVSLR